jgi:hypothetical protein
VLLCKLWSSDGLWVMSVVKWYQLLVTERACMDELEIYGITDPEDFDCQVCLTNVKDIVFLPCRHCCVCHECFEHIDKCPSCRGAISSHLTYLHTTLFEHSLCSEHCLP